MQQKVPMNGVAVLPNAQNATKGRTEF